MFNTSSLYIPIWLYSNKVQKIINRLLMILYIPIWLYSNIYQSLGAQALLTPLHSNLVIFKYQRITSQLHYYDLYIPIWLYSNKTMATYRKCPLNLYIPIWLYSNYTEIMSSATNKSFTFQSGYIQIRVL